jgi:hypothetical protein
LSDPRGGIVSGLGVELGRAERGALEGERCARVGAAEAGAGPVEHLQRLPVTAGDLQHATQRKSDRDLSGRFRCGTECRLEMGRGLRVCRVGLGEAQLQEDAGAKPPGRRFGQRPPQVGDGRVRSAVRDRGAGGRHE